MNAIAFCFDIKQAFLQICLAVEQKDAVRFLWSDDEPCVHKKPKLRVYHKNTKRFILQAVGKIFDPLGLISPFTVRMKCLLQDLWKEEIQWDDPLSTHIEKEWKKWCEELPHLRNLKEPRLVLDSTLLEHDVKLHSVV
ncbi:integrase catalytic domain-containing protein [Trichonephila clavipes]|nr:integrase catalytic domain-containing protein [Trichonephila clavipes]